MKGLIWEIQKNFFQAIAKNQQIIDLKIPIYGNAANLNAAMPYIIILGIKISNIDSVQVNRKNAYIKISIFNKGESLKKIANISDIIEEIVTTENIISENIKFISIQKKDTDLVNNPQTGMTNIAMEYQCVVEITTLSHEFSPYPSHQETFYSTNNAGDTTLPV